MKRSSILGAFVAVLVLAGLGYSAWRFVAERNSQLCKACTRPIHAHSKTVAVVDGQRGSYCCPACALSEHQQSGKPVNILELTDHLSGSPLKPEESYVVRNSDVNHCLQHQPMVSPDKQPLQSHFDRCSPSILAFRDKKLAEVFANEHGGQVLKFSDVVTDFQR